MDTYDFINSEKQHAANQPLNEEGCVKEVIDSNLLLLFGGAIKKYQKDEFIFHEGQEPHFYHQLIEGKVKMFNETDEGKIFIQGFFMAGSSFGEPPIFNGDQYPASAIADEASVIIRLNIASFIQLLKENFDAHLNITTLLSKRLKSKQTLLKEISCYNPEHRVITLLNLIKKEILHGGPENKKVRIDYTRQELAAMTGVRVETVIRILRSLNEKEIVLIEKGKVYY